MSFTEKLDEKSLEVFNKASEGSFQAQAIFFLNAFWVEHGDKAPFIYSVIWDLMVKTDMAARGFKYVHEYFDDTPVEDGSRPQGGEGNEMDFDISLAYFESLVKIFNEDTKDKDFAEFFRTEPDWKEKYKECMPEMQTSIKRKKELRDKVDVNFNGKMSMLEFLLYQLKASPKDLVTRMEAEPGEDPEVTKARLALAEVTKAVNAYEAERKRLSTLFETQSGVKKLKAGNELEQLEKGPLMEALRKALITAEAAVRIAIRKSKQRRAEGGGGAGGVVIGRDQGSLWWMDFDLQVKKRRYGRKK